MEASSSRGIPVVVAVKERWPEGESTPVIESRIERSLDGRRSWVTDAAGATDYVEQSIPVNGNWNVREQMPTGTVKLETFEGGLLRSVSITDSAGVLIQSQSFTYDSLNRTTSVTDARSGTTTYTYYADNQVQEVVAPAPGSGDPTLTTR